LAVRHCHEVVHARGVRLDKSFLGAVDEFKADLEQRDGCGEIPENRHWFQLQSYVGMNCAPTSSLLGRRRQKRLWLKEEEGSCDGEEQSETLYLRWMASRFRRQGRYFVTRGWQGD